MEWGRLFNENWTFAKKRISDNDEDGKRPETEEFIPVEIPHDWLIGDSRNLYENSIGWYRKIFEVKDRLEKHFFLRFDGIYMDSILYVNGKECGQWKYGYSAFCFDITEYLKEGENELVVRAVYRHPNSRWYSGAGIYRNVWLQETKKVYFVQDSIYIVPKKEADGWRVSVSAQFDGKGESVSGCAQEISVRFRLYESNRNGRWEKATAEYCMQNSQISIYKNEIKGQKLLGEHFAAAETCGEGTALTENQGGKIKSGTVRQARVCFEVKEPKLWDTDNPNLYILELTLLEDGQEIQTVYERFGFRTLTYLPDTGFYLNGEHVKLNGVCEHHDLGCLGAAYNQAAMRRKFRILKEMGVNAVRTAHNMPAAETMDLADETGMMILSESFDMWERPKTKYDYGRFFAEWYQRDVESWIRRDRNHPSVIMWSIGNEIYDTHAGERGQEITRLLCEEVRKYDTECNAPITIGSNYMPWENARKCADIVKLAGYNYSEKYYETHHKEHPDWIIYGSETASIVQSRGIYHFPYSRQVLADEDLQCSALGNSRTSWGAESNEACILAERDTEFSCGQFLWSGFDYIGEPTPYHTKNSYFGQIDTAGFPKDSFYIYQSMWKKSEEGETLHLFPYWDFNRGQTVDVRAASNAKHLELFLNGVSMGEREIDLAHGKTLTGNWSVTYEPGELRVIAYDDNHNVIAEDVKKSFTEPVQIVLSADRKVFAADGKDLIFVEISTKDAMGNPVENAVNPVKVTVEGCGRLAGTDNGDSTDYDSYQSGDRYLFSGKLLAVIRAGERAGKVKVRAESPGLQEAVLVLEAIESPAYRTSLENGKNPMSENVLARKNGLEMKKCGRHAAGKEKKPEQPFISVRKIELSNQGSRILTKEYPVAELTAVILPENATDRELLWSVVDDGGIPSCLAEITFEGNRATVRARGDGAFRVRCMSKSGSSHVRVISQLDFVAEGLGPAFLDPYGFVSGGLYQYSKGTPGNGNEHGVATARDGETQIGYRGLDFGSDGSDEITLPIFALSDEKYRIRIYEGMPDEGGELIGDVIYQKPSVWNTYQEETYRLSKKLKGVTDICFVLENKVHIKGFFFTVQSCGFERAEACSCAHIYGDSFRREKDAVYEIGNNVTLEFPEMDFGEEGLAGIVICGHTTNLLNTIHVRFEDCVTKEESRQVVEFAGSEDFVELTSELKTVKGRQNVKFVFLPGSNFDFRWFQFIKKQV